MKKDYILKGDCLELIKQLPASCVDMVLTDPPYNINLVPQRGTTSAIAGDNMDNQKFVIFLTDVFKETYRVLKDNSIMVSFMGWQTISLFEQAILESGFTIKSMPIWVKNNFGIGYYTRPQFESMFLCFKGTPPKPKSAISDVLKFPKVPKQVHSCQKPEQLIGKLISTFSPEGGLILDPFAGSGTTAVAAHRIQRHFITYEIDDASFILAKNRIESELSQLSIFDM